MKTRKSEEEAVSAFRTTFTREERARVVLTCAECGGKFAPREHTKRTATAYYCTQGCRLIGMRRRMDARTNG